MRDDGKQLTRELLKAGETSESRIDQGVHMSGFG